jgi:DNA-binding CsgD family transcriptional regulator
MIQEQSAVGFTPRYPIDHYTALADGRTHLSHEKARAKYVGLLEFWERVPLAVSFSKVCRDNEVTIASAASWLHLHGYAPRLAKRANAGKKMLTPKMHRVACLVASGMSSKEIAAELEVEKKAVVSMRGRISLTLGIHDIATLTRYVLAQGWIDNEFAGDSTVQQNGR